jgi:hypothetical protein
LGKSNDDFSDTMGTIFQLHYLWSINYEVKLWRYLFNCVPANKKAATTFYAVTA